MQPLTIELPAREDQTDFNLRRWIELSRDCELARNLEKIEGRIETDRHGHVILMSPPPAFDHGSYQLKIGRLLSDLLPEGRAATECPLSTADGVKASDVAWISRERLAEIGENICLTKAPEICVEVISPSNTRREMREKKALYFAAGASEVWFCDENGAMTFFNTPESTGEPASRLCPNFPKQIEL